MIRGAALGSAPDHRPRVKSPHGSRILPARAPTTPHALVLPIPRYPVPRDRHDDPPHERSPLTMTQTLDQLVADAKVDTSKHNWRMSLSKIGRAHV